MSKEEEVGLRRGTESHVNEATVGGAASEGGGDSNKKKKLREKWSGLWVNQVWYS